uniref:(northern house mosquito) hypothetical protein n=1 Tax=Culex pipiens TaxID=7175 RepID=A0A8D8MNM5_CULPI
MPSRWRTGRLSLSGPEAAEGRGCGAEEPGPVPGRDRVHGRRRQLHRVPESGGLYQDEADGEREPADNLRRVHADQREAVPEAVVAAGAGNWRGIRRGERTITSLLA